MRRMGVLGEEFLEVHQPQSGVLRIRAAGTVVQATGTARAHTSDAGTPS